MKGKYLLGAIRKGERRGTENLITLFEAITMAQRVVEKESGRMPLHMTDSVSDICVGTSPLLEEDQIELMIRIIDAYYNDIEISRKAVNNITKDGRMLQVLSYTEKKTRIIAYAEPGDERDVLQFSDKLGEVKKRISWVGRETFKELEEPLKLVCTSPRIVEHGGEMEILMVQFIENGVDMDSVDISDNWARMTTLTKDDGSPKTVREIGVELAKAFGECKPCLKGTCCHGKDCRFKEKQDTKVREALCALNREKVRFATTRSRSQDVVDSDEAKLMFS
jgi:hypothetical protein